MHDLDDLEPPVFCITDSGIAGNIYVQYSEPVRFMGEVIRGGMVFNRELCTPTAWLEMVCQEKRLALYFPDGILGRDKFSLELPAVSDCEGNHSAPMEIQTGKASCPEAGRW